MADPLVGAIPQCQHRVAVGFQSSIRLAKTGARNPDKRMKQLSTRIREWFMAGTPAILSVAIHIENQETHLVSAKDQ